MASLVIEKVCKSFGPVRVLNEVSFAVMDGEFCVLLGPSGCGKSTLLRLIAGLESPTGGSVSIDGRSVDNLPPRDRDVAFVFQNYALYPHMTVAENLGFSLRLRGVPRSEMQARVIEVARLLELEGQLDRKPQQLSGGQRQRVALGRAIVRRPKIFLFDEPLSNLDATLRASMRVELARLHGRLGATMLYVTHDQAEAMTLGEKIIVLNQGRIQQIGTPQQIYHRPANTFVAGFIGQLPMNLLDGALEAGGARFRSGSLSIDISGLLPQARTVANGENVTLGIRPESLICSEPLQSLIHGEIEVIEDLGADRFIHVQCSGANLVVRTTGKEFFKKGQTLHLSAAAADLHLFCQGARLDGTPD